MRNRQALFEAISSSIAREAGDATLAVLALRIRRVRDLNLMFGYDAGEAFVREVERVVQGALRARDLQWRTWDDTWTLVLPGLRERNHAALAAAKLLRALQAPVQVGGQPMLPAASIGIATFPHDGRDAPLLCRLAEQACEDADAHTDRFAFHQARDTVSNFEHGELREAIAGNRLDLFLQPIADLRCGRIDRCEALSRWNHPVLGAIAPDVFVRVAEQTGLIGELTRWSLNVALRHLSETCARVGRAATPIVSINIAVDVLQQPGFVEQVDDLLRVWGVPAERLVFEITESGLMADPRRCERLLRQLRERGAGVAIDDFGTGYSSMAYLRRLPATELKIDQSFVRDMRTDPRARKLVASMIDLAHHLGLAVVAEGVEDAATLRLLQELGCDHAQGFHVGRPGPAEAVMATLAGDRAASA